MELAQSSTITPTPSPVATILVVDDNAQNRELFLTALRDPDTFDAAVKAGGDDFLTKPIRPTVLTLRVAAALELRRMGRELPLP